MIILWVLLWILIILGSLVGLVILIALILGLGRIKYKVDANIGDDTAVYVNISYLLRLVRFVITYKDGEYETKGRIAWFKLGEEAPPQTAAEKHAEKETKKLVSTMIDDYTFSNSRSVTRDYNIAHAKEIKHYVSDTKEEEAPDIAPPEDAIESDETAKEAKTKKKPRKTEQAPDENKSETSVFTKAKLILTYPDLKIIIALCFQCLGKLYRALKPKRLNIQGVVGFDDPATTGWFFGAYEATLSTLRLRDRIRLLGSYHEKALRLDIDIKGRVRLFRLLWPFLWLYLKKPIRAAITILKTGKGQDKEKNKKK